MKKQETSEPKICAACLASKLHIRQLRGTIYDLRRRLERMRGNIEFMERLSAVIGSHGNAALVDDDMDSEQDEGSHE